MKVAVKNLKNEEIRQVDLPPSIFAYPYKEHLIHLAVVAVQAAWRSGSHKVKVRSEVRGSTRKIYRQKGTGRARAGSLRSPLWRSGGTVHGPRPRSHDKGLSPREKRNALKSALSRKVAEERIVVIDGFELENAKTAELARRLEGLGVDGKVLLVDRYDNEDLYLAARNNPRFKTVDALSVNVYDVVDRPFVVMSEAALGRLVEVLSK